MLKIFHHNKHFSKRFLSLFKNIFISKYCVLTCIHGDCEHGRDVDCLDVEELHGVDGRHGEGGGLLVGVVQLVEVLTHKTISRAVND